MTVCNDVSLKNKSTQNQLFKLAIKNSFIADALAMPVHWFYRVGDILKIFPDGINRLYPAPKTHPSSIMSLHSKKHGGGQVYLITKRM